MLLDQKFKYSSIKIKQFMLMCWLYYIYTYVLKKLADNQGSFGKVIFTSNK